LVLKSILEGVLHSKTATVALRGLFALVEIITGFLNPGTQSSNSVAKLVGSTLTICSL
jgi:hypothetical protein